MTPQLISVQGEALHGNQLLEGTKQIRSTFTVTKKRTTNQTV
ncbi:MULTISPECIES: hypothetical protein [Priestia]|nr:hypothetical protein [Priestia aryabhattai]MED3819629.1 hypothetical protein [Priestia aryabhattai]